MDADMDYLLVLRALEDIPFGVGKKLLADFLQGDMKNESIVRNRLDKKPSFGSMAYSQEEIFSMIDSLLLNGLVSLHPTQNNKFVKVLELTPKGREEMQNPSLHKKKVSYNYRYEPTLITEDDKRIFAALGDALKGYNDEQKKAIISKNQKILCIAGAGSGKTSVLTKRIDFLIKYRTANPSHILAITFTRKARSEMLSRLENMHSTVHVETFNSFCEGILRKHGDMAYQRPVRVITYRDRLGIISRALTHLNMSISRAINIYFSAAQQRGRTQEELSAIFMNDCFFVRDYLKSHGKDLGTSFNAMSAAATLVFNICAFIDQYMRQNGLRDFADQLTDVIDLFTNHPELIPEFDHILVDEYQDVNMEQITLLELLRPQNLFCVGDPRQSIYGWRGSDIRYILNFEERYPGAEIITLTKNYRSTQHIVELINEEIRCLGLADLVAAASGESDIHLRGFDNESEEYDFVMDKIVSTNISRNDIFVLARTNRQLADLSAMMAARKIAHVMRTDELRSSVHAGPDDVTLATVHAIKGLEAKMVFVLGCTAANFPCKVADHPVIDMITIEEYDKEEEERRLLYVALSRARNTLYMTYTGKKPTHFVTAAMMKMLTGSTTIDNGAKRNAHHAEESQAYAINSDVLARLREWRKELSRQSGAAAYLIMHDRTMEEIAQKMPMSEEDLDDIYGLGPTKIRRYGKEILRMVNGF